MDVDNDESAVIKVERERERIFLHLQGAPCATKYKDASATENESRKVVMYGVR